MLRRALALDPFLLIATGYCENKALSNRKMRGALSSLKGYIKSIWMEPENLPFARQASGRNAP